jgi:hypothetical protein
VARFRVEGPDDVLDIRAAYLRALEAGEDELIVEWSFSPVGGANPPASGSLELAPVNAKAPPAIDVTIRAVGGRAAITGIPLAIAGRTVRIEGIALLQTPAPALSITASASVALEHVTVLDAIAPPRPRAALEVAASGPSGTRFSARCLTVSGGEAPIAALSLQSHDGGWFSEIEADDVTLADVAAEAVLAISGVRRLRAARLQLRGTGGPLLRLTVPAQDAELRDSAFANSGGIPVLEVLGDIPPDVHVPPTRLAGESLLAEPATVTGTEPLDVAETCRVDAEAVAAVVDGVVATARAAVQR